MANIIQSVKDAFNQQTQKSIADTTNKIRQYSMEMARANKETATFSSDAVNRGRITLENFGRTFDNATRKVLVWQVAIMSVYGVIRKVGEVIQDWKDLELTLARISITTGAVGTQLQNYFRQVADIAVEFGMPIKQTLAGMDLALRATASLGTGAKKTATAIQLLRDASILANLTGMQYGQSMDILVGALRQTGLSLDQGIKLLDKWVAVSKTAAVSVADLSQGFAIMADAAEAAGLTVDQMNGLVAALSEKVTLSSTEIGNAIRSLMSTLYNQASITALQKYGVAVKDTAGEARNFWDIMTQLSSMRVAGVLDDSAWLNIARAAGGGARRYAQFLALLDSIPTAMRVANVSTNAQGDAVDANAKIVETLTNTWDKFTESQKKLFMTMGSQSGAIRDLTNAIAGLTSFINKLANAGAGVWNIARAFAFLIATLGGLKVLTAAFKWLGVAPRLGTFLGGFAGVPGSAIAGTGGQASALMGMQAGVQQAQQAARIAQLQKMVAMSSGTDAITLAALTKTQQAARLAAQKAELAMLTAPSGITPGTAGILGLGALRGLLPGGTNRLVKAGYAVPAGGRGAEGYLYGMGAYGPMYNRGAIPAGAPQGMTWSRISQGLTKPAGWGKGAAIAGVGAGMAAYGLTGEAISSVGAALGSAAGMAFGGPAGMVAGAAIGTLIGHTITDAFVSDEQRLKALFQKIAQDFNVDLSGAVAKASTPEEARKLAEAAAPTFTGNRLAEAAPFWKRLLTGGVALGGPVSPSNELSFNAPWVKRPGEQEWTKGLGGLNSLNDALAHGVITIEEYRKAKQKDFIAWNELSDAAKAYMTIVDASVSANKEDILEYQAKAKAIEDVINSQRKLQDIDNRYSDSQARIRELIKSNNLEQWESANMQKLLSTQMRMTDDEYDKQLQVLLGSKYGYAAHLEAVERLAPALKELGLTVNTIPQDKWLLIQRWDINLATKIVETTTQLTDLINRIDSFKNVKMGDILTIPGVEGTISDIEGVRKSVVKLSEQTSDQATRDKLTQAIKDIDQYYSDLQDKQVAAQKLGMISQAAPKFQRPGEVRLIDKETLDSYRKNLGQLPAFTKLAESLREFDTSVVTLVDPITGQTLRLEENTLALSMLQQAVNDNTAQEKRLEAEYNLPGWYQKPNRYSTMKQLGGDFGGFGPAQEGLWQTWMEYLKQNKGYQIGGTVPETGPYFLHKRETVTPAEDVANTNSILSNSYSVLLSSQGYLSSINLGITALRQEMQMMRQIMIKGGASLAEGGTSDFSRVTNADYVGVSSLGVKRR